MYTETVKLSSLKKKTLSKGYSLRQNIKINNNKISGNLNTIITQMKDPIKSNIPQNSTLRHGTRMGAFNPVHKVLSFGSSGDVKKPSPPAWFTINNIPFNLHVVAVRNDYTSLPPGGSKEIYVHSFTNNQPFNLNTWKDWPSAVEWVYRKQNRNKDIVLLDLLSASESEPKAILKQAQHNVLYKNNMLSRGLYAGQTTWDKLQKYGQINDVLRQQLKDEVYKLVEESGKLEVASYDYTLKFDKEMSSNTNEAAEAIKIMTDTPEGYIISQDLVRNEQEIVLLDNGIQQINQISVDVFKAKKRSDDRAIDIFSDPARNTLAEKAHKLELTPTGREFS